MEVTQTDLERALERTAPEQEKLWGNFEDLRVTNAYSTALGDLNKLQVDRDNVKKFYDIHNKLANIDETKVQPYSDNPVMKFNDEHSVMYNHEHPIIKQYYDYAQNFTETHKDQPGKNPISASDFFEENPQLKNQLMLENPNYFKQESNPVKLTPEEMRQKLYETAGVTPEDGKFYDDVIKNHPNLGDEYARKLTNALITHYPDLISRRGKLGDTYANLYLQQGQQMGYTPTPQPKWETKYEDGKLIQYRTDPTTGKNQVKVEDIGPGKEQKQFEEKIGFRIVQDEDGNNYYEVPKNGQWVRNGLTATDEQYQGYLTQLKDKGVSKEDFYNYRKQTDASYRIGRKSSRTGSTKLTEEEGQDFGKIKGGKHNQTMADKYFGGDVDKYNTARSKLMHMTDAEAKRFFKSGFNSPESKDDKNKGTGTKKDVTPLKTIWNSPDKKKQQDYIKKISGIAQNPEEKQAIKAAKGFYDKTIKDWKRDDLTPDEWRREIAKHNAEFSDVEFEFIVQFFKDNFGEDY